MTAAIQCIWQAYLSTVRLLDKSISDETWILSLSRKRQDRLCLVSSCLVLMSKSEGTTAHPAQRMSSVKYLIECRWYRMPRMVIIKKARARVVTFDGNKRKAVQWLLRLSKQVGTYLDNFLDISSRI